MKNYSKLGFQIPQVLLPKAGTDLTRWAVIACDQFTSQPEYWNDVERIVGDAPSTLRLILPEVYLEKPGEGERIQATQQAMKTYVDKGLFETYEGLILVERQAAGKTRRGVMLALDLECYDFNKGSQSLIRATEGTILERLPPRIKIRSGAPLELPHILVLIDDPQDTVIGALAARKAAMKKIYDFDLMLGSGHLTGYFSSDPADEQALVAALEKLADPAAFASRYGVSADLGVLLFAMGDGNHSLATAKAIWEQIKLKVGMDHPARYALVEIENVHDAGLEFEPIHRVLFDVREEVITALKRHFGSRMSVETADSAEEMTAAVDSQSGDAQVVGLVTPQGYALVRIQQPETNLPVGTLQLFLDAWLKAGGAARIDYVHGADVVTQLGSQPGNAGFYVPGMDKSDLFKTVVLDGALPRKTFSMGEAKEKRFYMEARRIA
ncbi:DUF1015 domain-containing protein [Levilinea saccharolytica]|nr:DUF1015 domain-containing protein [Levilinea saccharolytica]GAP17637.1 hypothetical protein LSAC_01512 [Levilinea saccharolytica]